MAIGALSLGMLTAVAGLGFGPLRRALPFERWLLAVIGSVLTLSCVSLALVRLSSYAPWLSAVLTGAIGAAAFGVFKSRAPFPAEQVEPREWVVPVLALLAVLGCLYALFPTYFLLGGQDPGVYVVFAAHIAKTGGLNVDQPWLRELWAAHPEGLAHGYPGIYSLAHLHLTDDSSQLSPQFAHLFPALAANVWSAFGLEGVVRTNAGIAVLVLATAYAIVRRLVGPWAGVACVLVLGLNPAFVWAARITLTEMLAALINLTGLLLILIGSASTRARAAAVVGGLVLGVGVLNRLDACLASTALVGLSVAALADRSLAPSARAAALGYLGMSAIGFWDANQHAPFYFQALVQGEHLGQLMIATTASAVVALGLAWMSDDWLVRLRAATVLRRLSQEALVLLGAWLVVALVIWPRLDPSAGARSALELTWYLTPIAWPLTLLGCALALPSEGRALPLVTLAATSVLVLTAAPHVAHQHIWASRRAIPVVIPLTAILSMLALGGLARWTARHARLRAVLVGTAALCYFVPAIDASRPFLFKSLLRGLPAAYDGLIAGLHEHHIEPPLVTSSTYLGSVLTYVYGVPTVELGNRARWGLEDPGTLRAWGRGDFEGVPAVGLDEFQLRGPLLRSVNFAGEYLEMTEGRLPRAIVEFPVPFHLGLIGGSGYEVDVAARHPRFYSTVGLPQPDGSVVSSEQAGLLHAGPCLSLAAGTYEVDWLGSVERVGATLEIGELDFVHGSGKTRLANRVARARPTGPGANFLGGLELTLPVAVSCAEVRFWAKAGVKVTLSRVRLRRVDERD